jgi:hypothetical protein
MLLVIPVPCPVINLFDTLFETSRPVGAVPAVYR